MSRRVNPRLTHSCRECSGNRGGSRGAVHDTLFVERAVRVLEPFRIVVQDLGGPAPGRSYDNITKLLNVVEETGC